MDIIVLKEEHRSAFAHLLPEALTARLGGAGTFSLGLLERREDGLCPAGAAVARIGEHDAEILWIFVRPELRLRGAGAQLLGSLVRSLRREAPEAPILALPEVESEGFHFFRTAGFTPRPVGSVPLFETSVGALAAGKLGKFTPSRTVLPLSSVPSACLRRFERRLQELPSAPLRLPLRKPDYLPCSTVLLEQEEVAAMLLFAEDEGQEGFSMVYCCALGEDRRREMAVACGSVRLMAAQHPAGTPVRLLTMDRLARIMADSAAAAPAESVLAAMLLSQGERTAQKPRESIPQDDPQRPQPGDPERSDIEARIRRLEAEAAREPQFVTASPTQLLPPPPGTPPPRPDRWARVKIRLRQEGGAALCAAQVIGNSE